jgi:hypothetical protein
MIFVLEWLDRAGAHHRRVYQSIEPALRKARQLHGGGHGVPENAITLSRWTRYGEVEWLSTR